MQITTEQFLHACHVTNQDRELIRLYGLHGQAAEEEIAAWFQSVDFEALPMEHTTMAAVMCAEHRYAGAPPELKPRLEGILRYHRMHNTGLYAALCTLAKALNSRGIDVMILKGAAIKIGYDAGFVRPMWDTDIQVRQEDYETACRIAMDLGYTGIQRPHSIDLHRGTNESIDLHCVYVRDLLNRKNRHYWPEHTEHLWNGARILIPERHALLLQLMTNACGNITASQNRYLPLRWVMDLDTIVRSGVDWDRLVELAISLELQTPAYIMLVAYAAVLPDRLDVAPLLRRLNAERAASRFFAFLPRYCRCDRRFRNPPKNCSALQLAAIHIHWLWMDCRVKEAGSLLRSLRCFPTYLCQELQTDSLLQLPAVALRKIRNYHNRNDK